MKRWIQKKFVLFCAVLLLFSILNSHLSFADPTPTPTVGPTPTPDGQSDKLGKLQGEINDLQGKINNLQSQEKTLSSQIAVMDSQIKLTTLRINATEEQIVEITQDIETTQKKIASLEHSLDDITKVLVNRIIATYEVGSVQPLALMLSSGTLSDVFKRANYLRVVQAHDKQLIYETQQAKNDYANQKQIFEDKKAKVESLKKQLESYNAEIDKQKREKEEFLRVTKNSETEYQRRLADALRELRQIQKAASVLVNTAPHHVNRGDLIGIMGNSGYSFGAHLHFGVYNISKLEDYNYYSNYDNPASILEPKTIDWQTGCSSDSSGLTNTGSGSLMWPMSTDNLHISQNFGHTCYSNVYYGGNPHPAFDMYNNFDTDVKAVAEGQAYFCRNCTGDGGNGVFLFHSNGKMTLYWHLQ